jgi:hypothetical protein
VDRPGGVSLDRSAARGHGWRSAATMGWKALGQAWLTRDTLFGVPIDDIFSFRTPKVVRIQDRTLGAAPTHTRLTAGDQERAALPLF